jgi:hypothetical protein
MSIWKALRTLSSRFAALATSRMRSWSFMPGLSCPEVWIIDRDSKTPEIYTLTAGHNVLQPAFVDVTHPIVQRLRLRSIDQSFSGP